MEKYDFFYGGQVVEFERPEVPEIIAKKGIQLSLAGSKYNLVLSPSKNKVVILNVRDKAE